MLGSWLATGGEMSHLLCWGAAREEQVEHVRELKDSALDRMPISHPCRDVIQAVEIGVIV